VTRLVAVPNVSEGRDAAVLDAIQAAFAEHADVLHRSEDPDHHRAVFMLAAPPGRLHRALARGAASAAEHIDLRRHDGLAILGKINLVSQFAKNRVHHHAAIGIVFRAKDRQRPNRHRRAALSSCRCGCVNRLNKHA